MASANSQARHSHTEQPHRSLQDLATAYDKQLKASSRRTPSRTMDYDLWTTLRPARTRRLAPSTPRKHTKQPCKVATHLQQIVPATAIATTVLLFAYALNM